MSFVKKIIIENSCMRDKVYSWDCSFQAVFLATGDCHGVQKQSSPSKKISELFPV
jgi:hypothetical protein